MGISLSKKSAPSPDMPKGYDDPDSHFFIPEPLRPFWAESEAVLPRGGSLHEMVDREAIDEAWREAEAVLGKVPPLNVLQMSGRAREERAAHVEKVRERSNSTRTQILNENYSELAARVSHRLRFGEAARRFQALETKQASRASETALHTCPVCNQDVRLAGPPKPRALVAGYDFPAWTLTEENSITSCILCYTVAAAVYLEQLAADVLPGSFQTRRSVVEAALTNEKSWN